MSSDAASTATATPDTATASHLRFAITRLHRLLRQHSPGDLTLTQNSMLATIYKHGPITLGELATIEGVARPTVTNVVDKLEARGLVARNIDSTDRRVCRVSVTEPGERHLGEVREQRTLWLNSRLADLGADDLARLNEALPVLERLCREPGADPGPGTP